MIADWIFIAVAVAGTLFGVITDLKGRWIPDWISYFMIIFGITGHILISIAQLSIWPAVYSAAAAGILFGVASLLYYTGIWGGGDAKLLVGLGALLPVYTPHVAAPWPWLLTLWLNTLIFGAVFGILGSVFLALKYKEKFLFEFRNLVKKNKIFIYASPALFILPAAIFLLGMPLEIFLFSLLIILFPFIYLILKSVENSSMFKLREPHKLVEGDWIAEDICVGNYNYKPAKTGIEKKDIEKLVELEKQGKLKQIKIKEGLPYIPAILAGLIISIFYGDIMFSLVMGFLV